MYNILSNKWQYSWDELHKCFDSGINKIYVSIFTEIIRTQVLEPITYRDLPIYFTHRFSRDGWSTFKSSVVIIRMFYRIAVFSFVCVLSLLGPDILFDGIAYFFILTSTRFSLSDFARSVGMRIRLLSHRIPIDFRTTQIPMHAHIKCITIYIYVYSLRNAWCRL